jgi:hypothetical protein
VETKDLSRAYKELLAAAEAITDGGPLAEADRAQTDWLLAHIALSDRALADAARQVLAGQEGRIDNASAMSKTEIARVISATTHAERIDMVRRNAQELIDVLERTPDSAATASVRARLVDRAGEVVFDTDLAWGAVVRMRAVEHIPGHAATLASFLGPCPDQA